MVACESSAISATLQSFAIVFTVCTGKSPFAVSPESITASAPSMHALPTSTHSARVGSGAYVMLSSIWVAQITGLPALRAGREEGGGWAGRRGPCGGRTPRGRAGYRVPMPRRPSGILRSAAPAGGSQVALGDELLLDKEDALQGDLDAQVTSAGGGGEGRRGWQ